MENLGICRICNENYPDCGLKCNHLFCQNCLAEYVYVKMRDADVNIINCPECEIPICDEILEDLLTKSSFIKYREIKDKKKMASHKRFKYCPKANCKGFDFSSDNSKRLICVICGYSFCMKCYHELTEEPCSNCIFEKAKMINLKFFTWKLVKKCPGCNYFIWKDGGCNNMTCDKCKLQWCWICGYKGTYHSKFECLVGKKIYNLHWEFLILSLLAPVSLLFSFFLFIRYKIRTDSTNRLIIDYPVFSYFWSFIISPAFFLFFFTFLVAKKIFKILKKRVESEGCCIFSCFLFSCIAFFILLPVMIVIYVILSLVLPLICPFLLIAKIIYRISRLVHKK